MQEVYCFILPFVLKWLVAALIASVLVSLFSRLRRQGDRSSSSIYAQVCALLHEWLQSVCHHILSSKQAHLILVHLIGRGRLSAGVSKVTRYAGTDYRTVEKDQCWHNSHSHLAFWASLRECVTTVLRFSRLYVVVLDHPDFVRVMSAEKLHVGLCSYFQASVGVHAQVCWSACHKRECQACCDTTHTLCAASWGAMYTSNYTGQIHGYNPWHQAIYSG